MEPGIYSEQVFPTVLKIIFQSLLTPSFFVLYTSHVVLHFFNWKQNSTTTEANPSLQKWCEFGMRRQ